VTEVPFSFLGSHVVLTASADGVPVFFILDTGAPTSFLDEAAAAAARIAVDRSQQADGHGLDGGSVKHAPGTIGTLAFGGRAFADVPCRVAALAPFRSIRSEDQHAGLLGNDFLARFSRVDVDFARGVLQFVD
jgi:predicted aspartyl protease